MKNLDADPADRDGKAVSETPNELAAEPLRTDTQLAELSPPGQRPTPQLPDEPDLLDRRLAPLANEIGAMKEFVSETLAVQTYGQDAVEAAKHRAEDLARSGAPEFQSLWARLSTSRHPMDELVRWDREQSALKKYGADPDAFIAAEVERRLQESPAASTAARQQFPSSFAAARSSAPRENRGGGPRSLSEIMKR